jgi:orotate phosphoribosyltransferase
LSPTGGAAAAAARALRDLGATVTTVVCAIDRSGPGQNPLAAEGIEVRAVLTKRRLDAAAHGL